MLFIELGSLAEDTYSLMCALAKRKRYYITIRRWKFSGASAEPGVLQKDSKKELCSRLVIDLFCHDAFI